MIQKFMSLAIIGARSTVLSTTQRIKMSTCTNQAGDPSDIVWMDLEMTGLDITKDEILEVSCIITDKDLNIKTDCQHFAINHAPHVYDNMNEWCTKHHFESGLIDKCKNSSITLDQAENIILSFLKEHIPEGKCPLAGNSIYMDRLFINKFFPAVNAYLHHRIIDVSTISELAIRWNPQVFQSTPPKTYTHRSAEDIKESIEQLRYYKDHLFK